MICFSTHWFQIIYFKNQNEHFITNTNLESLSLYASQKENAMTIKKTTSNNEIQQK